MSDDDIAAILVQSRANNPRYELTGALLYHQNRFIQVLEGPDEKVRARFDVISQDPRHRSVQVMSEKRIADRQFPDWTMGFRPVDHSSARELDGFDDFFGARTGLTRLKYAESETHQMLEWLAEYWFPRSA